MGTIDGTAELWDAASGAKLASLKTSSTLPQAVLSPDGGRILTATSDNAAHLLKPDGTELKSLLGHETRISAADFSPDSQLVATASLDGAARIWSVKDGTSVATLRGHGDEVTIVSFSPDGQSLLTASRDGTVRIWGVSDGKQRTVLRAHSGEVSSAQFSPNGSYIVTASSRDRTVRIWATQSGREIAVLASPSDEDRPTDADTGGFQLGWNEGRHRLWRGRRARQFASSRRRRISSAMPGTSFLAN